MTPLRSAKTAQTGVLNMRKCEEDTPTPMTTHPIKPRGPQHIICGPKSSPDWPARASPTLTTSATREASEHHTRTAPQADTSQTGPTFSLDKSTCALTLPPLPKSSLTSVGAHLQGLK